jgi:hypothetical protein
VEFCPEAECVALFDRRAITRVALGIFLEKIQKKEIKREIELVCSVAASIAVPTIY